MPDYRTFAGPVAGWLAQMPQGVHAVQATVEGAVGDELDLIAAWRAADLGASRTEAARAMLDTCQSDCNARGECVRYTLRWVDTAGAVLGTRMLRLRPELEDDPALAQVEAQSAMAVAWGQLLQHKDRDAKQAHSMVMRALQTQQEVLEILVKDRQQTQGLLVKLIETYGGKPELSADESDANKTLTEARAIALNQAVEAVTQHVIPPAMRLLEQRVQDGVAARKKLARVNGTGKRKVSPAGAAKAG